MNSNWRNRPTHTDYISRDINHIVAIDESGNADLNPLLKAKEHGTAIAESEKHFVLSACLFSLATFEKSRDIVMALKRRHWEDALFEYKDGIKRVCLHSRDIRQKKGPFSPKTIDYDAFISDLSAVMDAIPFTLFSMHINKERHVNQYYYPDSPYDLSLTFLLERVMRSIPEGTRCVLILESRGKKEDGELLKKIISLMDHGSRYHPAESFKKIQGVYFNPKWSKAENNRMSYWELELADLCAYPVFKHFTFGNDDKSFQTILPKIYGYPNHKGKGLKSFP